MGDMLTLNYRYRLYPDATQETTLSEWMETCRSAYNYALREIKDWCHSRQCLIDRCSLQQEYTLSADLKFPSEVQQLNALPAAKKAFPRLGEVFSQVLQQTIKQLHRGWDAFVEWGYGFPRFKKVGQFKSLLFPQFQDNPIIGFHLKLPTLGLVPITVHRPIPEGFVVKQVSLRHATLRILKKKDFHFKQAHALCDAADLVFMEDLDYRISAKGMLGKPMLDGAFGQFRSIVAYVCRKRDKFVAVVNANGTSQECLECGAAVKKDLSVRVHCCPGCRYTTDSNVASGQVIRNRGIALVSIPGLGGNESACAVGLPGSKSQGYSRSEAKSRQGATRKAS
jgi:transposase